MLTCLKLCFLHLKKSIYNVKKCSSSLKKKFYHLKKYFLSFKNVYMFIKKMFNAYLENVQKMYWIFFLVYIFLKCKLKM